MTALNIWNSSPKNSAREYVRKFTPDFGTSSSPDQIEGSIFRFGPGLYLTAAHNLISGGSSSGAGTHILVKDTGVKGASPADIDGTWRNAFAAADKLVNGWSGGVRSDYAADAVFVSGSGQPREFVGLAAFTNPGDLGSFGFTMAGYGTGFDEVRSLSQGVAGRRIVYTGDANIHVGVSGGPLFAELYAKSGTLY
ncbi:MAG: hypothetical protein WA979_15040 [Pacificimonas sp.]